MCSVRLVVCQKTKIVITGTGRRKATLMPSISAIRMIVFERYLQTTSSCRVSFTIYTIYCFINSGVRVTKQVYYVVLLETFLKHIIAINIGLSCGTIYINITWRHNEHDGVWNHRCLDCFLNRLLGADQRKTQSSTLLAFVRGIHRLLINSPHKGPVTRKCFHLITSSWMMFSYITDILYLLCVYMYFGERFRGYADVPKMLVTDTCPV